MSAEFGDKKSNSRILPKLGLLAVLLLISTLLCYQVALFRRSTFRHVTIAADVDGDGDMDVIHGHTRWENPSTSFAGVTLWINQGNGEFVIREENVYNGLFSGFAAGSGDVDNDGDTDLMVLDGYDLSIIVNQGNVQDGQIGSYSFQTSFSAPVRFWGHADMGGTVLTGDLNNDSVVDAFNVNCCYGDTGAVEMNGNMLEPSVHWVSFISSNDRGRLVADSHQISDLDRLPVRSAALGDIDSDGDLDALLAIGKPTAGDSLDMADRILLNDGAGNFIDSGQRLGEADSYAVALGDLDADGDLDALVGISTGARIWINQEGVYSLSEHKISGANITSVFLEDFDNDGGLDALIAGVNQARIWWNDGDGSFTMASQQFHYTDRHGLAVADFDVDGFVDVFAGLTNGNFKFWRNQGAGSFQK